MNYSGGRKSVSWQVWNNNNLNDLHNIINDLFQNYFTKLKLAKNTDIVYFKAITNFTINNNFIMLNSKIYLQATSTVQGEYSSSMIAYLFLNYYECCYIYNSLHLHRHIVDIILISTDNVTKLKSCSISLLLKIK